MIWRLMAIGSQETKKGECIGDGYFTEIAGLWQMWNRVSYQESRGWCCGCAGISAMDGKRLKDNGECRPVGVLTPAEVKVGGWSELSTSHPYARWHAASITHSTCNFCVVSLTGRHRFHRKPQEPDATNFLTNHAGNTML